MFQNRTWFSGILFSYPNLSSFSRRKTKLRFKVKNEMNLYFLSLVSSGQSTRRENKNSEDVWVNINNSNRRYFLAYDSSFTFIGTEFMVDIRKRKNEKFCTFSLEISHGFEATLNIRFLDCHLQSLFSFLKKRNISRLNLLFRWVILISSF
jgi:hypothetical protein